VISHYYCALPGRGLTDRDDVTRTLLQVFLHFPLGVAREIMGAS
jgi:hypothetical protein